MDVYNNFTVIVARPRWNENSFIGNNYIQIKTTLAMDSMNFIGVWEGKTWACRLFKISDSCLVEGDLPKPSSTNCIAREEIPSEGQKIICQNITTTPELLERKDFSATTPAARSLITCLSKCSGRWAAARDKSSVTVRLWLLLSSVNWRVPR